MNILALLLILAVAGMTVAHIVLFIQRMRRRQVTQAAYRIQCPECRRKLRYRTPQIGKAGMCPRCRHKLTFPTPAEKVAVGS